MAGVEEGGRGKNQVYKPLALGSQAVWVAQPTVATTLVGVYAWVDYLVEILPT